MASYQSRIAAHNILHRQKIEASYHAVPRCTFTDPEVASVGITEAEAREKATIEQAEKEELLTKLKLKE